MKIVTCDICNQEIRGEPSLVRVRDGEHPHNGSVMYKKIDVCKDCIVQFKDLESRCELDALKERKF